MATTYENMVLRETHRRETASKISWGLQHASESSVFNLESQEFARLDNLKKNVADLCDLQPTPASMVRPPRKEMLKELRGELAQALVDAEAELEAMGGSVSAASMISAKTAKSKAASVKSAATASWKNKPTWLSTGISVEPLASQHTRSVASVFVAASAGLRGCRTALPGAGHIAGR